MSRKIDIDTRNSLKIMRQLITESEDNVNVGNESLDTVPYTKNDELLQKMTSEATNWFGASFTKSKTPLLYDPANGGDVILTGEVPSLDNAVFQFRYRSANSGIFVWADGLSLTDEVVRTISQINGAGKNWKKYLDTTEGGYKPINARDENLSEDGSLNETRQFVRGDDLPSESHRFFRGDDI